MFTYDLENNAVSTCTSIIFFAHRRESTYQGMICVVNNKQIENDLYTPLSFDMLIMDIIVNDFL